MLIGIDTFFEILDNERIILGQDKPFLHTTIFAWVVTGRYRTNIIKATANVSHVSLAKSLTKFWEIGGVGKAHKISTEDQIFEHNFSENISRDQDERYVVALHLKSNTNIRLGSSLH